MRELYDILRKDEKIGELLYENGDKFIQFIPGFDILIYPAYFQTWVQQGILEFGTEKVDKWIRTRILPEYRQDLSDVLHNIGMDHYDMWELFKFYNGGGSDTVSIRIK